MHGTAEDLRGCRLSEIGAPLLKNGTLSRLITVFNTGGNARFELDFLGDSGGDLCLSVSASTMGDLESFRLLFEGNPVPMFLCDVESLAFLAVNDAAIARYGYDRDSFLTLTLLDIVPREHRDNVRDSIRNKPELSGGPSHPWQHVKADGSRIDVLTYWQTTIFRDRSAELVAIMDVTETRRAETRIAYMAPSRQIANLRVYATMIRGARR